MASAGVIGGNWIPIKDKAATKKKTPMANRVRVCRASYSSSSVIDPYKTLRIEPGASESEVRKAFRQLALQVRFLPFSDHHKKRKKKKLFFVFLEICRVSRSKNRIFFFSIMQYHPDVCRGSNCGVQFHKINEAYDVSTKLYLYLYICMLYVFVSSLSSC